PISDGRRLLQGRKRVFNGQEDGRLQGTHRSARTDRERRSRHRHIIRGLPQTVTVMFTEGVPETVQLSANRFNVLLRSFPAVLGVLDTLRPRCWRVAEPGQV